MTSADKQRAYQAKRAAVTNVQTAPLRVFRLYLPDGREVTERAVDGPKAWAIHPAAWRVEEMDRAGFW